MNVELNPEQTARLELISLHAGKRPAEMLLEAAQLILDSDREQTATSQNFLPEEKMEERLARLLRNRE
jgi:hypothetical protein